MADEPNPSIPPTSLEPVEEPPEAPEAPGEGFTPSAVESENGAIGEEKSPSSREDIEVGKPDEASTEATSGVLEAAKTPDSIGELVRH